MLKVKVFFLSVFVPLLLSACAESRMQCVGTGSFAPLATALCPQVAGVKSAVVGQGMHMPVEQRQAGVSVEERNGRIVRTEAGLEQTFWK